MGGTSAEREVSLESGANVAAALESLGRYEVFRTVLDSDSLDAMPAGIDCAYIALHGGWGENGGVQSALDALGIPYTGPGAAASRLAMDKLETKRVLDAVGVPTAQWVEIHDASELPPFGFPAVVKLPRDGSSIGVFAVRDAAEFADAAAKCLKMDPAGALAEKYISGREATVALIAGHPLPAIEIVTATGWYGYDEKYRSDATKYVFLDGDPLEERLAEIALAAWKATGCRGVARVDFRVDGEGNPYVLELNTSPGFTAHSLVPKAGMKTGLSFAQVCEKVLMAAACGEER